MAGHIHPGFSLKEKSGSVLRSPCFQVGKNRIILPAFGTFTGIQKVKPESEDRIFMTNGQEVIEVPVS
jgi:metallophosphoesterase superfamily enzyme